jgi:hypothetical protein
MDDSIRIQKLVQNHFEETDIALFTEIVEAFVYEMPTDNAEVSKEIEKFIEAMGITDGYVKYLSEKRNKDKIFTDRINNGLIEDIKVGMLNTTHNKCRVFFKYDNKIKNNTIQGLEAKLDIEKINTEIEKTIVGITKKTNKFLINKLLEIITCLNNNEQYFYSKKEDTELVEYITELRNENRTNNNTKIKRRKK